jgi:predicted DNA-binding transcriptional regulator AlpA
MVDFPRDEHGETLPEFRGVLRAKDAARFLGISRATLYRYDARGVIPRSVKIGRCRGWRVEELRRWLDKGCPGRDRWEAMKS